jgi:maleylpyruvate isomerase
MLQLVDWAITGVPHPMYASWDARGADIEAGSGRAAEVLAADVRASADRLAEGLERLGGAGPEVLDRLLLFGPPRPDADPDTPARSLPCARRRELEIHHVDLGLGYGPRDWPTDFVERTLIFVHGRSGAVDAVGEPADVLAWRLGRPAAGLVRRRDGSDAGEPPPW